LLFEKHLEETSVRKPAAIENTACTDADRQKRLTSEDALLGEYRRLGLPAVRCGGILLSPALVELLQRDELDEQVSDRAA
jgi:hypothetical protein